MSNVFSIMEKIYMNDLMKVNCYDVPENLVIIGSCLPKMEPKAFEKLKNEYGEIFEVCLEEIHLNMVITKVIGMLSRVKVKKVIFATVDKSPHCIQMHYIENEIKKAMKLDETEFIHYVAVENRLIEISNEVIKKSKSLAELMENK